MATLRYVADDTTLNPAGEHEPVAPYWLAADDEGNYDGTGPDPLSAMADLATELELALRAACDPAGPVAGDHACAPLDVFMDTWAQLMVDMPDEYSCSMTCVEADAAAGLFRAHGRARQADAILAAHARHDLEGDAHYNGGHGA